MPFYYLDTSALVKRYHVELGSERINAVFDNQDNALIISELATVEVASALQRRQSRGEISRQAMHNALARFAHEAVTDLIVAGFSSDLIQPARDLVLQYGLRTLDALQLALALQYSAMSPIFVCADARLRQAAFGAGLDGLDPEAAE